MIIGKSCYQKYEERQIFLRQLYKKRFKGFAWLPVQLNDYRWVWLQTIYFEFSIVERTSGELIEDWHKYYYLKPKESSTNA